MTSNTYHRDQVVSIINSVIHKVSQPKEVSRDMIFEELHMLKNIMEELRQNLGSVAPGDLRDTHIPSATDELDAVVGATESASSTIMDSCDHILSILNGQDDETTQEIQKNITAIYEACTFQDITGQRIAKVVGTLKTIDGKISGLLAALEQFGNIESGERIEAPSLLNGPGLPHNTLSQDEIDSLLEGL